MSGHQNAATLEVRPLGRTDMNITRVGFGAWAIGGGDWVYGWGGAHDHRDAVMAIRRALDGGVNWIDTAAVYGLGRSEEVVRDALVGIPADHRPYVFTKCGLVWDDTDRMAPARRVGAAASLRQEVEASLRRLGVERIDLYQMHWPADDVPVEVYWQTLLDLKAEGKVRAVGLSNHSTDQLRKATVLGAVDSLQPPFSAIRRDFAGAELPWCRDHDTGVIVYSPMQSGLLTGAFTLERARALVKGEDWRSGNPQYSGGAVERNLKLADALRPIASRRQTTVAAVAVAWTLAWPGVTGAIVGARRPGQVDGWLDALTLTLDAEDLDEIAVAIAATGAGSGPFRPAF